MRRGLITLCAAALLIPAAVAQAHVELAPERAPAGAKVAFTVTVPNERTTADTIKVALRLPAGFTEVTATDAAGWTSSVRSDGQFTVVTWTGGPSAGKITGENVADFAFVARTPNEPGTAVAIPATQTYTSGEVDRWIGSESSELPAPRVTIGEPAPGTATATTPATTGGETTSTAAGSDGGGSGLLIAGVIAAGLVSLGALAAVRMRRARRAADRT